MAGGVFWLEMRPTLLAALSSDPFSFRNSLILPLVSSVNAGFNEPEGDGWN